MSTLTRNDGVEFVLQAYRELIQCDNKSALAQKIRSLAEQHGRFVRLFKKSPLLFEAVFSNEAGYLLGESVKHYFYQAQNLIFCEAIDEHHVLTVVVRDGEVYLDALIAKKQLYFELQLLMGDKHQYRIYTHGNVPLKEINTPGQDADFDFIFPKNKIVQFEKISEPLFVRLPTLKVLQLLPLPLALKSQHLNGSARTITYTAICIIATACGWMLLMATNNLQHHPAITIKANPYAAFDLAMRAPSVKSQFNNVAQTIESLLTLPGWQAQSIHYAHQHYEVTLKNAGGNLADLQTWCAQNQFSYTLNQATPVITKEVSLPARKIASPLLHSQQQLSNIADKLTPLLGAANIALSNPETVALNKKTLITLHLNQTTPAVLNIIGELIGNEPVTLENAELTLKNITINGQIKLSLWGS